MITIDLELNDKPGELIRTLVPISDLGINLFSVIHLRDNKKNGRIPVRVVIDEINNELLDRLLNLFKEMDILITKINKKIIKKDVDLVVIGHVVDTDIKDTIDRLNCFGLVLDLDLSMPDPYKESSARFKIIVEEDKIEDLCNELNKISKEKNLLFIKSF